MIFDGITLVEGSEIRNLVVASGTTLPQCGSLSPPDAGELFYILNQLTRFSLRDYTSIVGRVLLISGCAYLEATRHLAIRFQIL